MLPSGHMTRLRRAHGAAGTALQRLLDEMNVYLDSLRGAPAMGNPPTSGRPLKVRFSCQSNTMGDCDEPQGRPQMNLAVFRPFGARI